MNAATVKPENNQAIGHPPNPYGDSNHFTAQQFATSAGQAIGAGRNGVQQQGIPAPAPPALPHGYSGAPGVEQDAHIHPELRNLREANGNGNHVPTPSMMQPGLQPQQEAVQPIMSGPPQPSSSLSPNMDDTEMGEGSMSDGRRQAKRELSQSKRAAQNRAAQRAFRQRKELYIKKLEQEVKDMAELKESQQVLQGENYQLRQYVLTLQSRLLDLHSEYPQPPPGLVLTPTIPQQQQQPQQQPQQQQQQQPQQQPQQQQPAPGPAPMNTDATVAQGHTSNNSSLLAVAQAVAGIRNEQQQQQQQLHDPQPQYANRALKPQDQQRMEDEARTDEEIGRQLQTDGALPSAPM